MLRSLQRQQILLPDYSEKEEKINMLTHLIGAVFGVVILITALVLGLLHRNIWSVAAGAVYGISVTGLFCVSSVYHGLRPSNQKRVMRIVDHCTIYLMICGTYTPILLVQLRPLQPVLAWVVFAVQWLLATVAVVLNTRDLQKYRVISMVLYIAMGWCIVLLLPATISAIGMRAFGWLLTGGVCYTVGAVFYGLGKKQPYLHAVFHLFVDLACLMHAVCILVYVL